MPSQALREWRRAPAGLLETIIEYRNYAHAKAVFDRAPTTQSPMVNLVKAIELELVQEELDTRE